MLLAAAAAASALANAVLLAAGDIGPGTTIAQRGAPLATELLLKRAIAIDEKVHGLDHPGLATSLDNLAGLYQATGRHREADAARGRRPQGEDHGPWTEAMEKEARRAQHTHQLGGTRTKYREAV